MVNDNEIFIKSNAVPSTVEVLQASLSSSSGGVK